MFLRRNKKNMTPFWLKKKKKRAKTFYLEVYEILQSIFSEEMRKIFDTQHEKRDLIAHADSEHPDQLAHIRGIVKKEYLAIIMG